MVWCCVRPSSESDRLITVDQLYLVDSGAQFRCVSVTLPSLSMLSLFLVPVSGLTNQAVPAWFIKNQCLC